MAVIQSNRNNMALDTQPGPLCWRSFGLTHAGNLRKHNEDAFLERPDAGLWAVADGMGGHSSGEIASQMITDSLKRVHGGTSLPRFVDEVEDKLLEVNRRLLEKSIENEMQSIIGSTVVCLLAYRDHGVFLWAGDSRIYRRRGKHLQQLSIDHSQVELYVEQGLISREQASSHPHGNMITRAVGAADELFLEMDICSLQAGDRFLLCSDGLTRHVTDPEINDLLAQGNVEQAANDLIELTLDRGAMDNVTVIVVEMI